MLNKFNDHYQDRGTVKWQGMYLSEHSQSLENDATELADTISQKPQMTSFEIASVLDSAIVKNKKVAIQIEEINENGDYAKDTIGKIRGYDELGIYIDHIKVGYDEIRNIQLYEEIKWSKIIN